MVFLDNLDKYSALLFLLEGLRCSQAAACTRIGDGYENVGNLLKPVTTLLVTTFDKQL